MKHIAIFASGGGSNALRFMEHFKDHASISIVLVATNNPAAGVIEKADKFAIPVIIFDPDTEQEALIAELEDRKVDLIVLAGYLKKIDEPLIRKYPNAIVNIHPALLPKYGGKGMYGMNVHRAVVEAGESRSGMTIHYVNENYDEGAIIEQHECEVSSNDTPEMVAANVLKLEHKYFAPCVERLILRQDEL